MPEPSEPDGADAQIPNRSPELPDRATYWAEYQKAVEAEYRAYAIDKGCDRVRETEEMVVTPAMHRIEAEDPSRQLVGLEFRLKGRDRLTEKVTDWLKADAEITPEGAFGLVKDAIRYTFQYSEAGYADGVLTDCERLKAAGFEFVDRKNSWDEAEYKGINSRWTAPENGQLFEVQFHTESSFDAKQKTHPAYERIRDPSTPPEEITKLRDFQREVSAKVPIPPRATEIPDYP